MTAIHTALAMGDIARASALAAQAVAAGASDPMLLNLAAWAREEAGDYGGAATLLERAIAIAPTDPLIRLARGAVSRKQGRYAEAIASFAALAGPLADNPALWLEWGYALEAMGSLSEAMRSFARATAVDPRTTPAWAAQGAVAARNGDMIAARGHAERAIGIEPGNPRALCTLAACEIDGGEAKAAVERLDRLIATPTLPVADRIVALTLLGDALDRLDAIDRAFAAYRDANACFDAYHRGREPAGTPSHTDFVRHLDAQIAALPGANWAAAEPRPVPGEAARHIFLLGYPRSGTTLTENILASLDGVDAIEEQPTLAEAERAFLLPRDGMRRLSEIGADEADVFRRAYWRAVPTGARDAGGTLVDMDPLKSLRLPLIARLFPAARIVMMRRDPRDVVWSCFRRNFQVSSAALEFVSLERTARHYDAVMRFVDRCTAVMPLRVHDVSYRRLVGDFDAETQAMCRFVGLPWSDATRRFDAAAARRGVRTASAAQVRRGLFDGGGQWRRYAAFLAPVLPILQPWIERMDATI